MHARDFEYGMKRAVGEIVGGIVTSAILVAIVNSGLLPPSYVLLFELLNLLGTISLILLMPYWGTIYVIGWLVGLLIMSSSGLIGILDLIIILECR